MVDVLWSDFRMPDGSRPGSDDVVIVDSDVRLIFDEAAGPAQIKGLVVYGEFTVEEADSPLDLTTDWAIVAGDGSFVVGTEDDPYEGEFTLTLAGKDNRNDVDLRDYPDGCEAEDVCPVTGATICHCGDADGGHSHHVVENNNAFLMAMGDGAKIEIHTDDAAKESWTQLDGTAEAGDTQLTFTEATGWQVGDRIAVASTDFDLNQAEEFTVVGVSNGGRTVTLDRPLEYMHYGEVDIYNDPDGEVHELDMRAEVGLLSRDVVIQGDIDYDPSKALNEQDDQYGGHTMVMHGGEMYLSGVELAYMGQAGILGRYPAHWHEAGDVTGQYIKDSSVHHSFNKGFTVHNTQGAELRDNVVFETISHNYYLEERETYDNVLAGNLGINARDVGRFGTIRGANDDNPSNFYTPNGRNTWTDNHAAGSDDKGFYFSLSRNDHGARGFDTFEGNSAHSTDGRAFYLNHAGLIQDGNPSGSAGQPQKVDPWVVEGFTTYKSDGVYVRGVEGTFTDSAFAEMGSNARFRLNQTIEDSLIVGRSDNIGNPQTRDEIEAGRSLPNGDGNFQGFQLYDGPGSLSNVMFDGFTEDRDGAIELSNAIHKSASFGLMGITWGENVREENKLSIGGGGNAIGNDSWARGFVDVDGSLTGVPGSMIYQYSSDRDGSRVFNAGEDYEIIEEWGAIVSYGTRSGTLRIDRLGTDEENSGNNSGIDKSGMVVTRSDGESATGIRVQIPVFIDYDYEIAYRSIEDDFRLYLHDMDWGDSIIVSLPDTPTDSSFIVDDPYSSAARPAREVTSMEMLEASPDTAVFRDADGVVHVKLVAEMAHGYLWPQPGAAMPGSLHSGVTLLVDTTADLNLNRLEFDDPEPGEALGPPPYAEGQGPDQPAPEPEPEPEPEPNEAPLARDDMVTIPFGSEADVDVLANDSDLDGDDLTVTRVEASDGVTAELHQGGVLVTPEDGFSGDATVSYTISDGNGGTGTAEIAVTVEAPEEPEEPVDPPETPGGETVMAFVESDGAVLIEAESYGDLPAGWVTRADYDKDAAPNLGALGGKNDFVMWQGADQSDAPGASVLTYYVVIETTGLYEFDLRDQPATDRPEVGGDTWVKIDGAQFYGLDDESTMYPEGAEPGSYPDGSVMLPVADGEDGWMRYQSTNRSTHWGSGGHVNDTGNRRDRHDIVVEFDAPGVYAIQLSGATPSSHAIGSFGLVNREVASEFSLQGEQSERREVALEDSGATPPPDPAPEPEPEPEPTPALEVGFSVVNGTTDIVVDPALIDGEEIDGQGANIVATPNIPVGSAVFSLNGEAIQTENAAPYAAFGNRGDDFAAGDLEPGAHTLSVEFFEGNGGSGASLGTSTVSFTVATPEPEPAPDPEPAPEPGMPFAVLPEDHDTPLASAVYDAETGVLSLVFDYDKVLRDPEHNNARHIDGIVVNGTAFEMELHPDDGPRDANGFIYDETTVENAFDIDVGPLDIGDGVEILLTNNPDGRGVYYSFTLEPSEEVPEPAPNMAPEAEDDAVTIPFGSEAEVNVLGNDTDPDGDTLSITAIDASDGVTAELHQGGILVTPEPGFSGPATVAYTISDGKGGSDTAQINVTVAERPNRAPDAGDDSIDLAFGSRSFVSVLRNDTDPDGDDLTITSVEASAGLTAIVRGPDILVGPEEGFSGDGRVIYTVSDGRGGTDTAQVFVTVAPEPEPEPELEVGFTLMNGDSDTVVDADLTDGEVISGEAVNIAATPNMEVGSAVFHLNGERVQLENVDPYALFGNTGQNYAAVDLDPGVYELEVEFFSQSRGRGESLGTSALTFEVEAEEPENTAPEARDDTAALEHGGELLVDVLDNDMDADGDALSILSVESSDGLQAAIRGDTVRVVADEGFSGDGVVSYTVSDGKGGIDSAEIAVTVAEPEAPAMFEAALYTTGNRRDVELLGLENGATIDSEAFSAEGNVTFALFSTDAAPEIGSVTLSYQGKTQVENVDPYALFGNLGENFLGGTEFAEGTHEIEVTVHSEERGEGEEIDAFTFEFEVV